MSVPNTSLRDLVSLFCQEADSGRGVTSPTAQALLATIKKNERLMVAAKRLLLELGDDGITEAALIAARTALAAQD